MQVRLQLPACQPHVCPFPCVVTTVLQLRQPQRQTIWSPGLKPDAEDMIKPQTSAAPPALHELISQLTRTSKYPLQNESLKTCNFWLSRLVRPSGIPSGSIQRQSTGVGGPNNNDTSSDSSCPGYGINYAHSDIFHLRDHNRTSCRGNAFPWSLWSRL